MRETTTKIPWKDLNYFCLETARTSHFSAAALLRGKLVIKRTETIDLYFVIVKARVAPVECLAIPTLELQAAVLASRLRQEVQCTVSLTIKRRFMWNDSTTVLQWLHLLEKKTVFVANRVTEILELTTVDEWKQAPMGDNAADASTRGLAATALIESSLLKSPDSLRSPN